jgi:type II secretory pathway pseudopilin PulG
VTFVAQEECMLRQLNRLFKISATGKDPGKGSLLRRIGIKGFTLLELFIVLEIIGFLATMVMSNYYRSRKAAEIAVTVQNVKNVQIALASYFVIEGKYPGTLNPIWLQFYGGRIVGDYDYIGGDTAGNSGGWDFFYSNSVDIRFGGLTSQDYAIRSKDALLPYAQYVYGDVATSAKIVH